ncbi:TPA: ead/Ea22-like family protein [Klebsiella michiganensis]|uniref:ead/Ea22-like family protein n=1 Tax=Klebsiella michiganensis TaxID=1134687 RepID=UPI000DFD1FCD|nr:phage EaA protein [Klebsiella michiganensis]STW27851.1 phage EaA protein [Klebsiella michiganensis]HDN2672360.1 ead/Ea22-like family protein [Klebsiella michiganensis]HDN2684508.1 ead/Ea22-like family protein [Klebsiella michiganensis]
MTDITVLAQSLKVAAENAIGAHERLAAYPYGEIIDISQHEGELIDIDITDLNEFNKEANPVNILALVEALEKSELRLHEVAVACATAEQALEKAQQRNSELEAQNEYIRKRYQQLDLLIGKDILVMQAAIIEWQATGDAKNGLAWIYNTLFGPGELPDEAEKDAQAYFDRKYAPLDEELMALHKWFWEQSEAERAAAGIKVEAE